MKGRGKSIKQFVWLVVLFLVLLSESAYGSQKVKVLFIYLRKQYETVAGRKKKSINSLSSLMPYINALENHLGCFFREHNRP